MNSPKLLNSPKLYHYPQNQIMKLSHKNRLLFIRLALIFSMFAVASMLVACCTNNWLYTSEWLKYYVENGTNDSLPEYLLPHYYKTASMGPWIWCWMDPRTPYNCFTVDHFQYDESSDTTTSVEIAVRIVAPIVLLATILDISSLIVTIGCTCKHRSYRLFLSTGVLQIFTGLASLLCLVMYAHSVTREVGKRLWPETPMDEPLFMYHYGYSFYTVVASYLFTELAAFLILFVYMAKHDEQMFNRYKIRSLFKSNVLGGLGGLSSSVASTKPVTRTRRYRRVSSKSMEKIPLSTLAVDRLEEESDSKMSNAGDDFMHKLSVPSVLQYSIPPTNRSSLLDPNAENSSWGGGSSVISLTTTL